MVKPIKNLFYYYRICRRKVGENCAKIGVKIGQKKRAFIANTPKWKNIKKIVLCLCTAKVHIKY